MRPWGNSLADAGIFVAMDAKNHGSYTDSLYTDDSIGSGSALVPSSAPYRLVLDYVPIRGSLTVIIDSNPVAAVREWGNPPVTAGEVSVNFDTGEIMFHEDDAGKGVEASYYHKGTVIDANWWNTMQKSAANPPVQSVNNKTGAVVLDATDIEHVTSGESVESFLNFLFGETENLALNKQDADTDLTALANINGVGFISRIASGAAAPRVLTAGTGITVTNGGGISGNPTVAVSQTGLLNTSSGTNTLLATHAFIQINLNVGTQTILLNNASIPVGWGCWASIINSHASNQLTWDAGSGNNVHATGVFAQTWAMPTANNVPHRWFRLCKISSTVWSIDTGAPS